MRLRRFLLVLAMAAAGRADVVDSVVAIVNTTAIKHSDVIQEIRFTAFLNREPVDLSPAAQQDAVNRLVDQTVIRQEIEAGLYAPEDPERAEALFVQLRNSYSGPEAFRQALDSHGITEDKLHRHLEWQASVLEFIELRFGQGDPSAPGQTVTTGNEEFFAWLDKMREQARLEIRKERLK
jgi:hypothetical protein